MPLVTRVVVGDRSASRHFWTCLSAAEETPRDPHAAALSPGLGHSSTANRTGQGTSAWISLLREEAEREADRFFDAAQTRRRADTLCRRVEKAERGLEWNATRATGNVCRQLAVRFEGDGAQAVSRRGLLTVRPDLSQAECLHELGRILGQGFPGSRQQADQAFLKWSARDPTQQRTRLADVRIALPVDHQPGARH